MASSPTEICNLSLSWLAGNRLLSLDDDESKEADLCRANYDLSRKAVLAEREWTFAIKRVRLPALAETPQSGGYSFAFLVPPDLITGRGVFDTKHANISNVPQTRNSFEGGRIFADIAPIDLKYVYNLTNTQRFAPIFDQTLAAHIAMNLCIPLTQNVDHFKMLATVYKTFLVDASAADGMQGTRELLDSSIMERSRRMFSNIERTNR